MGCSRAAGCVTRRERDGERGGLGGGGRGVPLSADFTTETLCSAVRHEAGGSTCVLPTRTGTGTGDEPQGEYLRTKVGVHGAWQPRRRVGWTCARRRAGDQCAVGFVARLTINFDDPYDRWDPRARCTR